MTELPTRRNATRAGQIPLVRSRDAYKTLEMLLGGTLAWSLPERYWDRFLRGHAAYVTRRHGDRTARHVRRLEQVFGSDLDAGRHREIVCEREAHESRSFFYRLREHAPHRWAPNSPTAQRSRSAR